MRKGVCLVAERGMSVPLLRIVAFCPHGHWSDGNFAAHMKRRIDTDHENENQMHNLQHANFQNSNDHAVSWFFPTVLLLVLQQETPQPLHVTSSKACALSCTTPEQHMCTTRALIRNAEPNAE